MIRALASRRALLLVALLGLGTAAALAALAVTLNEDGGTSAPPVFVETTYVEGVAGTWQRINPLYAAANAADEDLTRLIFAGLVRVGPDGSVLPDVADLPEISEDGRTYTFHLRPARWHDGEPLTSRDVAFTLARITDEGFAGARELAEAWAAIEVETPDLETVVLRLPTPSSPFLARFATIGILPEHLLAGMTSDALYDAAFNAAPVGAGPYRLDALSSTEARLVAHGEYHFGRPRLDVILVRFFPDYPTAQRALEAGTIDGLLIRDQPTADALTALETIDGVNVERAQRAAYVVLYLNNAQVSFQDPRVREAISLALDREALVDEVFVGLGTPSSSPVTPGSWAYLAEHDRVAPDPDAALALLADAGWAAHPTTGILVREGGEFRFTIRTDSDPLRVALASAIARQLEPLGIRATVASTSFAVLRRDFLQERNYEAAISGWDQGPDPDLYFAWHSSQMTVAGANIANFADLVADSLIARGRTEHGAPVRLDSYAQLQEIWQEDMPSAVVFYPHYVYARTDDLEAPSVGVLFTPPDRFFDVHLWSR